LRRICGIQHQRTLTKDLVISFRGQRYILQTGGNPCYALRKQRITVVEYEHGAIELRHNGQTLAYRVFDNSKEANNPSDEKSLNARVDTAVSLRKSRHIPPDNHPRKKFRLPGSSQPGRQSKNLGALPQTPRSP